MSSGPHLRIQSKPYVMTSKFRWRPLNISLHTVLLNEFPKRFFVCFSDGNLGIANLNMVLMYNIDGTKCYYKRIVNANKFIWRQLFLQCFETLKADDFLIVQMDGDVIF